MNSARIFLTVWAVCGMLQMAEAEEQTGQPAPGVLISEFVFEKAPFAQCHASTVAQTSRGLVSAWFGGSREGRDDVGIWLAHRDENSWSEPVQVATGRSEDGKTYPCWNPVLFQMPQGKLVLFYKVGPRPSAWWGMRMVSDDGGRSWSKPVRLGQRLLGPIKNKPVLLKDGTLLCGSSTEHDGWRVHLELTSNLGDTGTRCSPGPGSERFEAIQPTILVWPGGRMQILCRSQQKAIVESWSLDEGRSWSPLKVTELPNPNSGIDAVMLRDGRAVLVYNDTTQGRSPLNVAISSDGKRWIKGPVLESEPGEYSYPAVIQTSDGLVHVTYTWKRQRIKHVVLDPQKLPQN